MRPAVVATLTAVALTCALGTATASPRQVVADYFTNGRLDYAYPVADLRGSLTYVRRHRNTAPQYAAFADAVNQAITDAVVGSGPAAQQQLTTPRSRTDIAPAPAPEPPPSGLPQPPQGAPTLDVPWALPIIAIIAALLLLAGIGSSLWRRMRR